MVLLLLLLSCFLLGGQAQQNMCGQADHVPADIQCCTILRLIFKDCCRYQTTCECKSSIVRQINCGLGSSFITSKTTTPTTTTSTTTTSTSTTTTPTTTTSTTTTPTSTTTKPTTTTSTTTTLTSTTTTPTTITSTTTTPTSTTTTPTTTTTTPTSTTTTPTTTPRVTFCDKYPLALQPRLLGGGNLSDTCLFGKGMISMFKLKLSGSKQREYRFNMIYFFNPIPEMRQLLIPANEWEDRNNSRVLRIYGLYNGIEFNFTEGNIIAAKAYNPYYYILTPDKLLDHFLLSTMKCGSIACLFRERSMESYWNKTDCYFASTGLIVSYIAAEIVEKSNCNTTNSDPYVQDLLCIKISNTTRISTGDWASALYCTLTNSAREHVLLGGLITDNNFRDTTYKRVFKYKGYSGF